MDSEENIKMHNRVDDRGDCEGANVLEWDRKDMCGFYVFVMLIPREDIKSEYPVSSVYTKYSIDLERIQWHKGASHLLTPFILRERTFSLSI